MPSELTDNETSLFAGYRLREVADLYDVIDERGQVVSSHSHAKFARRQLRIVRAAWLSGRTSHLPAPTPSYQVTA